MKKGKVSVFLVLGITLIAAAVFILLFSELRAYNGKKTNLAVVSKMQELLPEENMGAVFNSAMPVLQIEGKDYCAILEIPAHGIKLAVADDWNNKNLFSAPTRFCGSAYADNLVIGGADNSKQFSFCKKIENGTTVTLTDMTGAKFTYKVLRVDRAKSAKSEWLTNKDYTLTLFCRDTYSTEYIAVRCVKPNVKTLYS